MKRRLPPSSAFCLSTAWPVLPEPAKESRTSAILVGGDLQDALNQAGGFGRDGSLKVMPHNFVDFFLRFLVVTNIPDSSTRSMRGPLS
jgi:hypothetical protein